MTTGYCPHCGRGDCSPTADQWAEQRQRAEKAEDAIARVRALLPPPEHDTDPTLAIHPSRIRAALDGTT